MVNVIQQAIEALEEAQTGLAWYRDRNPEQSDGSDDEAALRIEHAIHNLRAAQEGDLPPLPEKRTIRGNSPKGYAPRDMHNYARLALSAAGGGVPHDALIQARDMLESWSSYVPPYFAEKHGLKDDFATLDKWIASSPQPEAAPAVAQVPEAAEQVEFLDAQNHQLRRAIHAAMSRLSALLDEDQFAEMEQIFTRAGVAAPEAPAQADNLTAELQQRCSDWGVYWRAPDAHGVVLTVDQATELLRDALGVEVEIKESKAAQSAGEVEREPVSITSFDEFTEASDHCLLSTDQDMRHQAMALRDFAMPALRWAEAQLTEHRKDTRRLDWLDAQNLRFKMGWQVSEAPSGNVNIKSVIFLDGRNPVPIRDAIDAALSHKEPQR